MATMEALAARLVGTWYAVLVSDKGERRYFRFLEDLRFIEIVKLDPPLGRQHYFQSRLWCELESESVLRMRFYKNRAGDVRSLHFQGEILVLQYTFPLKEGETEPQKHVWHCHRQTDEEIPEWFEEQFQKAMAKPWL